MERRGAQACETLLAIVDRAVADLTARADECEQRTASEEARRAGELAFDASPIGLNFARHERSLKSTLKVGVASLKRECTRASASRDEQLPHRGRPKALDRHNGDLDPTAIFDGAQCRKCRKCRSARVARGGCPPAVRSRSR